MNFSEKEITVLRELALDPSRSLDLVCSATGLREHTVRRILQSLEERELIKRQFYLDLFRIGLSFFDLYFSMPSAMLARKQEILDYLLTLPNVAYLSEMVGEFQFNVVISDTDQRAVQCLIEMLNSKFGDIFGSRQLAQTRSLTDFPPFPLPRGADSPYLKIGDAVDTETVDTIDLQILSHLATATQSNTSQMGKLLQIPHSTITYRLERLRAQKIIAGERYLINYSKMGISVYSNHIFMKSLSAESKQSVFDFCRSHPRINYLCEVIGSFDYSIGTVVSSAEEQSKIVDQIYNQLGGCLSKVVSYPISRWHKISNLALVVDPPAKKRHLTLV